LFQLQLRRGVELVDLLSGFPFALLVVDAGATPPGLGSVGGLSRGAATPWRSTVSPLGGGRWMRGHSARRGVIARTWQTGKQVVDGSPDKRLGGRCNSRIGYDVSAGGILTYSHTCCNCSE